MIHFRKLPFLFLVIVFLFQYNGYSKIKFEKCRIKIKTSTKVHFLNVELAKNEDQRSMGLMNRKKMSLNSGMLFIFDREFPRTFWMKNTYIPLSIAYIDKKGFIVDIKKMKPLDTTILYPSLKPAMYALEVNQGWFKKNNVIIGDRLILNNGCISK